MRFKLDFAPSVATSLAYLLERMEQRGTLETYHTVATPYLREVKTVSVSICAMIVNGDRAHLRDYKT